MCFTGKMKKEKTREQGINYITHQEMKQFSPIYQG